MSSRDTQSPVDGADGGSHNGVHEDLERIYTVITTPEERVVMKPFKSVFDEINTAFVEHHLNPGSTAFRNLCMRWCRRAHEATRLLPRHLVIDCGCVVLNVWFRWALRYFSDQVASNCRRIVEAFKERNDTCRALLECDEAVDVVKLSHDEVIQCVVDDADALYPLYLCGDEQPFHILRGALDDVVQIHALLDLFDTLGQQLSHHLGVHRPDVKTIMSSALADLVTRPWIRRWVLLLVGAIHVHSPITAWMHYEDSLFQQWKTTNHRYVALFWNAFGALVKLTQLIFDDETRMTFVVTVAMVVLKEQMVRHVCPLAEWAVQTSTIVDVEADGCVADISETGVTGTRCYEFLTQLYHLVLRHLSFMSEWLRGATVIQKDRRASTTARDLFLVLIFSFFTTPGITSFDDPPELRHTLLYRLLEFSLLGRLERYLRSGVNTVSPMRVNGDSEADDGGSSESSDGSPTLESIFPFFNITNNTLLRTITQESDDSDTGGDTSTSEDSELREVTTCVRDREAGCRESDIDVDFVEVVFQLRKRILNIKIRHYSHWHRLSIVSQLCDVLRVVEYSIGCLVARTVQMLLSEIYSTASSVPSMDDHHDSVDVSSMNVSDESHEERSKQKEEMIRHLINAATKIVLKLKKLDSWDLPTYVLYVGMKNILASMSPDELDMYLRSIADAVHNYYLRCVSYSTWTSAVINDAMEHSRAHIVVSDASARYFRRNMMGNVDVMKALAALNPQSENPDVISPHSDPYVHKLCFFHMRPEYLELITGHLMGPNPEWLMIDSSWMRLNPLVDVDLLQSLMALPIPFDQTGVFARYMNAALRVRLLYRPRSTVLRHTTKVRGTLSSRTPPAVVVRLLDARYWGFDSSTYFLMIQILTCASSSTRTTITPQTQPSSDAEELPFPADLAAALVNYTHKYQQQKHHEQRQLHWCRDYAYTTFVMYYPQDGGLPTTIHGTLHLQRLFVALAGYKRVGVTWSRLAARAHMSVEELKEQLQKCVKLGLLVCVGKDDEGEEGHSVEYVAMNYDYVRPVESIDGVIEVWPECPRLVRDMVGERGTTKSTSDAARVKQLAPVVMSIMKQKKRVSYSELVGLVRAAVETRFVPTRAMMKSCVEGLIDRGHLRRSVKPEGVQSSTPSFMLDYV